MTRDETIKIMAMLSAFYGEPKAEKTAMANAWYVTLKEYDYTYATIAVHVFARKDVREYGSYPTLGSMIKEIENVEKIPHRIFGKMRQGLEYKDLEQEERWMITERAYNRALEKDEEELIDDHGVIINYIKGNVQKNYMLAQEGETK